MSGISNLKKVALDSNIFIYYFNESSQFGTASKLIFDALAENELRAITSITTLIEMLSSKKLSDQAAKDIVKKVLTIPNLTILDIDQKIAVGAAKIRRIYGFRTPDAIQLATAIQEKAEVFITNDRKTKVVKELKVLMLSSL
ncbi:MAG: PIN domain-containing protein [Candidatus Levybacteria bacterium]|nr:PIN domain-containing protein [Candidatus Levybacteria bacterium]